MRDQKGGGENIPSAADGTMTRWELLQAEEIRQELEDDSVYAYVFDRFLEENAARRLNVEVKQKYSFESMKLPREGVATSSAPEGVDHDGVVAFFLREQRRSQGITYSYTYVGPHALRSLFCTLRLIFMNTLVPLSVVITAFSVLAFPIAVWLRRFYLCQQLLNLMQQQQREQQTLMKSRINGESGGIPVVYCGCSSAHLSQLLVQQTIVHCSSLLRWWLQRAATKVEEVDAMCFELMHKENACVRRASHEGQNFWWVDTDIVPAGQHITEDNTNINMRCTQAPCQEQTQRPSTTLSRNSCQTTCGFLDAPAVATDSLLSPQFSMTQRLLPSWAPRQSAATHGDTCSSRKCEPNHTASSLDGTRVAQQADGHESTTRCSASIPCCVFAASTGSSSTTTGTADPSTQTEYISPVVSDRKTIQCESCTSSNAACFGQRALSSYMATCHPVPGQAREPQLPTEVHKVCHHRNSSSCQTVDLGSPAESACLRRVSPPLSADYSFSAFLARVSDMQRKTPGRSFDNSHTPHIDEESPYGAAGVGCGRSSVL